MRRSLSLVAVAIIQTAAYADPPADKTENTKTETTLSGTYEGTSGRNTIHVKGCTFTDEQQLALSVNESGDVGWKGYAFATNACPGQGVVEPFSCFSSGRGTLTPNPKSRGTYRLVLVTEGHAVGPSNVVVMHNDRVDTYGAELNCSDEFDQSLKSLRDAVIVATKDSLVLPVKTVKAKTLTLKKTSQQAFLVHAPKKVVPGDSAPPRQPEPPVSESKRRAQAEKLNDEGKDAMYANDFPRASAQFKAAIALDPLPHYYLNLCTSLFQQDELKEAAIACNEVGGLEPSQRIKEKAAELLVRIRDAAKARGIELSK